MFDLTFSLLDDGLPQKGRVIVLFRFTTPGKIVRSGMLNFDRSARRDTPTASEWHSLPKIGRETLGLKKLYKVFLRPKNIS